MPKGFTEQDAALLDELGVEVEPEKVSRHTAREERLIAGFEAIQRFVDTYGRAPERGEDRDIFERLFAVRLDRILEQDECRTLLTPLDRQGLLSGGAGVAKPLPDAMDDDALLAELGVEAMAPGIAELHHVRSSAEKRAAEEVATRRACEDFETFRPLFDQLQRELDAGIRETRPFERKSEIAPGRFFIVGGQKAYVAEMGEVFTQEYGDRGCQAPRDLRQRHGEQHAQALASARAPQRRGGSTDHRGNRRPALYRPSCRRRRDEWHDLRAAEQV